MKPEALQAFLAKGGAFSERDDPRTHSATPATDRSRLGIAAQHLVAFDILTRGYNCSISAEHLAYDLIADIGTLRRVQVKSRAFATYKGRRSIEPIYDFLQLVPQTVDLFAFVSMPERVVIYRNASSITGNSIAIRASEFTQAATRVSWREATRSWIEWSSKVARKTASCRDQ